MSGRGFSYIAPGAMGISHLRKFDTFKTFERIKKTIYPLGVRRTAGIIQQLLFVEIFRTKNLPIFNLFTQNLKLVTGNEH